MNDEKYNKAHAQPYDCHKAPRTLTNPALYRAAHAQPKIESINATAETTATLRATTESTTPTQTPNLQIAKTLSTTLIAITAILTGQWALTQGGGQETLYLSAAGLSTLITMFSK